ncbi:MAG: hypothetical protein NUV46_04140 [Nanoarchaeota archaeon]|nr:hypothetical protein [Nanoarchaeota archaeon]
MWARMIPEYVSFMAKSETLVLINEIFEIVFALLILLDLKKESFQVFCF